MELAKSSREHPDGTIYLSQPGLGNVLGARALGEFGDDPNRLRNGKARRNYASTSPITKASGSEKVVLVRFIHNERLADAGHRVGLGRPHWVRRGAPLLRLAAGSQKGP